MKWWAQSFLVGVPKIVCGFRDDDGIVKSLQHFKTTMIPHDSQVTWSHDTAITNSWWCVCFLVQNDLTMWQPAVCLNFLDELLTWIRKVVVIDGPKYAIPHIAFSYWNGGLVLKLVDPFFTKAPWDIHKTMKIGLAHVVRAIFLFSVLKGGVFAGLGRTLHPRQLHQVSPQQRTYVPPRLVYTKVATI